MNVLNDIRVFGWWKFDEECNKRMRLEEDEIKRWSIKADEVESKWNFSNSLDIFGDWLSCEQKRTKNFL